MGAEGMVHALNLVHRLIKPGGALIDIHPLGQPPVIEVCQGDQRWVAGLLQEKDDFSEYPLAAAALTEAVRLGWFELIDQASFGFTTHAATPDELSTFLAQTWSDAIIPPEVAAAMRSLHNQAGSTTEVSLTEQVMVSCYRKIG
jgi:hypothetical protein